MDSKGRDKCSPQPLQSETSTQAPQFLKTPQQGQNDQPQEFFHSRSYPSLSSNGQHLFSNFPGDHPQVSPKDAYRRRSVTEIPEAKSPKQGQNDQPQEFFHSRSYPSSNGQHLFPNFPGDHPQVSPKNAYRRRSVTEIPEDKSPKQGQNNQPQEFFNSRNYPSLSSNGQHLFSNFPGDHPQISPKDAYRRRSATEIPKAMRWFSDEGWTPETEKELPVSGSGGPSSDKYNSSDGIVSKVKFFKKVNVLRQN